MCLGYKPQAIPRWLLNVFNVLNEREKINDDRYHINMMGVLAGNLDKTMNEKKKKL